MPGRQGSLKDGNSLEDRAVLIGVRYKVCEQCPYTLSMMKSAVSEHDLTDCKGNRYANCPTLDIMESA